MPMIAGKFCQLKFSQRSSLMNQRNCPLGSPM